VVLNPFHISVSPRSRCWEMLGSAALAQPHVAQGMGTLCTSHHCGCVLVDTQLGRVELQGSQCHRAQVHYLAQVEKGGQDCR
jgi:hypothetical protein